MSLTIVKPSKYVDRKLLENLTQEVFDYLGEEFSVSVKFACENCIRGLNKEYTGKDEPTNVLSFTDDTGGGDIVICESVVEKEAKKLKYFESDLILLYFVHGMLHLAGFDHTNEEERAKMEKAEEAILSKIGVKIERD